MGTGHGTTCRRKEEAEQVQSLHAVGGERARSVVLTPFGQEEVLLGGLGEK